MLQVTPGNRAAAVVGGLNVFVFSIIAILANREKRQKKRDNQQNAVIEDVNSPSPSLDNGNEKGAALVDGKGATTDFVTKM